MTATEKRFGEVSEKLGAIADRVTKLETLVNRVAPILGVGLLSWLGWLSVTVYGLSGDVRAIKQALVDKQVTNIVSQLQNPGSPEKLQAALSTVIAEVQTARANNLPPNPKTVMVLTKAVSQAVERNPDDITAWQAASELILFRPRAAGPRSEDLPPELLRIQPSGGGGDCFQGARESMVFNHPPTDGVFREETIYHDCTMDLGDLQGFARKNAALQIEEHFPGVAVEYHLRLLRVAVRYSGGPVIPVASLKAYDCTFNLVIRSFPTLPGQNFIAQLLQQEPESNVHELKLT